MTTAFKAAEVISAQGISKGTMALILEGLTDGNLLPTWGEGETSAELTTRDVVSIILGATSVRPEKAAVHCTEVASLIRPDGLSFGEVLTKIMSEVPNDIKVDEITVSADSQVATIRYPGGNIETYTTGHDQKAFRNATIIRGSLLQALAIKMQMPTVSGWTDPRHEE